MFIIFVDAGHVACAWTQTDSLDAHRIFLKLERVNFLASNSVPYVNRWKFADLSCDNFGAVIRNIEAQNVITVEAELITALGPFLSHGDLFSTIYLLSVIGSVMDNT